MPGGPLSRYPEDVATLIPALVDYFIDSANQVVRRLTPAWPEEQHKRHSAALLVAAAISADPDVAAAAFQRFFGAERQETKPEDRAELEARLVGSLS